MLDVWLSEFVFPQPLAVHVLVLVWVTLAAALPLHPPQEPHVCDTAVAAIVHAPAYVSLPLQ